MVDRTHPSITGGLCNGGIPRPEAHVAPRPPCLGAGLESEVSFQAWPRHMNLFALPLQDTSPLATRSVRSRLYRTAPLRDGLSRRPNSSLAYDGLKSEGKGLARGVDRGYFLLTKCLNPSTSWLNAISRLECTIGSSCAEGTPFATKSP